MSNYRVSPFANIPPVVKNLLIINVLFFAAVQFMGGDNSKLYFWFGVFYPASPLFQVWQIVTYMFMHADFFHLFFNMFALFTFGSTLEQVMGSKRFLNFYLLTGLGALLLQFVVQAYELHAITGDIFNRNAVSVDLANNQAFSHVPGISEAQATKVIGIYVSKMVGASGAIFGLLVAFWMLFPNVELMIMFFPVPVKAKYIIPFYIVLELFLGVAQLPGDSVAHYAHLGGALFGFILVKMWHLRGPGNYYG